MTIRQDSACHSHPISRRQYLNQAGMGFGTIAAASLLQNLIGVDVARGAGGDRALGQPHFAPKAKSVIFFFMVGGVSHLESFDPKPALNKFAGKTYTETPFANPLDSAILKKNLERDTGRRMSKVYPLQTGFKKYGSSGLEVSDYFPCIGSMADELAVVRSMWTTDNNHQAQFQFLTGRNVIEGNFPSLGSWIHYGLGSLNENLPQYLVFGDPLGNCCGGNFGHGADYLGPQHAGVLIETKGTSPLPFISPAGAISRSEQRNEFALMKSLGEELSRNGNEDPELEARIKSYELAFRMQMAVPDIMKISDESSDTLKLYGLDAPGSDNGQFAKQCLLARKFVEKGVRFIQIHHGAGGAGSWDAHSELNKNHTKLAKIVDQPIAGLLQDLKNRSMLQETLIVFATEFGRTPALEDVPNSPNREGRDHHPFGFSVWMAGGGIKGGVVHGATDELGFHAVEDRHYVTDIHATILHQLGLHAELLDLPGRQRLEKDHGHCIKEILA